MMRKLLMLALALGLAACTADPAAETEAAAEADLPAPGGGVIRVAQGGGFGGFSWMEVHESGLIVTRQQGPMGAEATEARRAGPPGAYARLAARLAAQGPAVRRALAGPEDLCLDYGVDSVEAMPPVAGITLLSAGCPVPELGALIDDLRAAVAPA